MIVDEVSCADRPEGHHWVIRTAFGRPLTVRVCHLCGTIDWDNLTEQVETVVSHLTEVAEARADATRQMAIDANAKLREQLLGALGQKDDGKTSLSAYVDELIADRNRLVAACVAVAKIHARDDERGPRPLMPSLNHIASTP